MCVTIPYMLSFPRRLLILRLYRLPLAVVAVSDGVRDALVAMGLPTGRVTTLPNPVSLPDTSRRTATTCPLGRFVLAAGRLVPAKGFDMLLNAFSQVEPSNLQLVVLGDGPERDHLLSSRPTARNEWPCLGPGRGLGYRALVSARRVFRTEFTQRGLAQRSRRGDGERMPGSEFPL